MENKLKLSDYLANFLKEQGVTHVFAFSGGASLHLIHSIDNVSGIEFVCPQHEQAGAMAADSYARCTNGIGVAIATSGPGATNLLTGTCCSFYDSVPTMMITGQVSTTRMRGDSGVRQIGFQETSTVEIFKPVTKYASLLLDPLKIRYELEKAYHIATTGRPGPVLLDIPDNLQREIINPFELKGYIPEKNTTLATDFSSEILQIKNLLEKAERPVAIFGWGLHLAQAEKEALEFVTLLGIPVAPTWAAADIMPSDDELNVGTFGTHGTRHGNLSVQNSDFIISLGSRLDTKSTGTPISTFARNAYKVVVDLDSSEINKFGRFGLNIEMPIQADVKDFLNQALSKIDNINIQRFENWLTQIKTWKRNYPICPKDYWKEEKVNPYCLIEELSAVSDKNDLFFIDTGCSIAWMMQGFAVKQGQRLYHDFNNTAMGWAIAASIGASFAHPNRSIICITGDGSLQINIQELATIIKHNLPIKILLLNNRGHSMIQQTQDQWLGSKYLASSEEGGLACPNFMQIAEAYGFKAFSIDTNDEIKSILPEFLRIKGPLFCDVEISSEHRVSPQVKFGRPNEDPEPLLERQEFFRNMIVPPLSVSESS